MKLKRLIAILAVTAMMASTLFGCGNVGGDKTTEAPAQTTEGGNEQTTEAPKEFSYPMEGNPTVTIWSTISNNVSKSYAKLEDRPYAQELMKLTGINVEWTVPSSLDTWKEDKELFIAAGELTDIIGFGGNEVEQQAADEVIIPLDDVIEQYMPNYKAYLEANPDIAKIIRSNDGHIYYVPLVYEDPSMGNTFGVFARQDWMTELGIKTPETMDEWYDALVKVKEEKGAGVEGFYPIVSTINNLCSYGAFLNAYCPNMSQSAYYVVDGKVTYTPATDGFKEFLTTMNKWYEAGLIHPDFASLGSSTIRTNMASGLGFVSHGYAGSGIQRITGMAVDAGDTTYELTAIATAAKTAGAEILYQSAAPQLSATTGGSCITTDCKNIEAAARLLDFYWTEAGFLLNNFGIEGTTYTVVDGVETYTDWVLNNPSGLSMQEAMAGYMVNFEGGTGVQALNYLKGYYSALPSQQAAPGIWSSKGECDHSMALATLTVEESDEAKLYDVTTTMKEYRVKFITGELDIEAEWDNYIKKLNDFGLQELLKIYQTAYDRYAAK